MSEDRYEARIITYRHLWWDTEGWHEEDLMISPEQGEEATD